MLSGLESALDFWQQRLTPHKVEVANIDRFDKRHLAVHHPSGIEYVFVPTVGDERDGFACNGVPAERAIHGIGIHVTTPEQMVDFANVTIFSQCKIS